MALEQWEENSLLLLDASQGLEKRLLWSLESDIEALLMLKKGGKFTYGCLKDKPEVAKAVLLLAEIMMNDNSDAEEIIEQLKEMKSSCSS